MKKSKNSKFPEPNYSLRDCILGNTPPNPMNLIETVQYYAEQNSNNSNLTMAKLRPPIDSK